MKPYLTSEEVESILDLIKSNDSECNLLGLNILVSKSFKTIPSRRTAIYNAQNILRIRKNSGAYYSARIEWNENELIKALRRYQNKLGHAGN